MREVVAEREGEAPMVVHCSGGGGRSGTFATVYNLYMLLVAARGEGWGRLEEHLEGEAVTLAPLVRGLREARHPWMVEGEAQYKLAYSAVAWLLQHLLQEKE